MMKVEYSPLNSTNGGVDLDLAGRVLKQKHTAHHTVEADSGQLGAAGDPVSLARVFVDGQAVGENSRNTCLK